MSKDSESLNFKNENSNNDNIFNATTVEDVALYQKMNQDKANQLSDEEIAKLIEHFTTKGIIPPSETHVYILRALERRRVEALIQSNYDAAEKSDKIATTFKQCINSNKKKEHEQAKISVLYDRYLLLQSQVAQIDAVTKEKIQQVEETTSKKKDELQGKELQMINEVEEKFSDGDFLTQFGRPSQELTNLREMEKNYAITRRYAEAKAAKVEADALQKIETRIANEKMQLARDKEIDKVYESIDKERESIEFRHKKQMEQIAMKKNRDVVPLRNAIEQMRAKKTSIRLPLLKIRAVSSCGIDLNCITQSPRTQKLLSNFKITRKAQILPIKPIDEAKCRTPKRANNSRSRISLRK